MMIYGEESACSCFLYMFFSITKNKFEVLIQVIYLPAVGNMRLLAVQHVLHLEVYFRISKTFIVKIYTNSS